MKNAILERVVKEVGEHFEHYAHVFGPKSKVIDVGTGTGLAARHLHEKGINVIGLDITSYGNYQGSTLIIYDGIHMPFSDSEFDVALLLYVLRHARNAPGLLEEVTRVAKKIIVIEEFLTGHANPAYYEEVMGAIGLKHCIEYEERSKEEFEKIVDACHLRINELKNLKSKTERRVEKYLYILSP